MCCLYITKKFDCKKIMHVTTIWGGGRLVCFHPIHISIKLGSKYTKIQIYGRWVPMINVPLYHIPLFGVEGCSFIYLL
jgi:hypothetical protein